MGDYYLSVLGSDTADASFTITARGLVRPPAPTPVDSTIGSPITWSASLGIRRPASNVPFRERRRSTIIWAEVVL
jgi:hypothetical protein